MASTSNRMIHQDYIARIRYSNALPPPPNPPKLLQIPNTGLSSGQYTTPGYASRLVREQPLNIEADAELGMPLDLVGMPGIFDGDESSIQAPLQRPPVHPHDRALLRPLATLGKPQADAGVSFLRRTEYISSHSRHGRQQTKTRAERKPTSRAPANVDRESPAAIKAAVEASFVAARDNLQNRNVRHPTKPHLKLVSAAPLLPDINTYPDLGGYALLKFLTNPVPPSNTYDERLETAILRPIEKTEAEEAAMQAALQAHQHDPVHNAPPPEGLDYEFYMADSTTDAQAMRTLLDKNNPKTHDEKLYSFSNTLAQPCIRMHRVRAYETAKEATHGTESGYEHDILLTECDGSDGTDRQRAFYYYPIIQETHIRPQRHKNINSQFHDAEERMVDMVDVKFVDAEDCKGMTRQRAAFSGDPYGRKHPMSHGDLLADGDEPATESDSHVEEANGDARNGHAVADEEPLVDAEGDQDLDDA